MPPEPHSTILIPSGLHAFACAVTPIFSSPSKKLENAYTTFRLQQADTVLSLLCVWSHLGASDQPSCSLFPLNRDLLGRKDRARLSSDLAQKPECSRHLVAVY